MSERNRKGERPPDCTGTSGAPKPHSGSDERLVEIHLDESSLGVTTPEVRHERDVAIFDLLETNYFSVVGHRTGPYRLDLSISEGRLVFRISTLAGAHVTAVLLSLKPFRRIVKDYFLVCESYFEAIKSAPPSRIEAIDMGRRGLHDEGSRLLMSRLEGKVEVDFDTARRLFTLICALHWKG